MGVIAESFHAVKESFGDQASFQRGCRDVPDKAGTHKRSRGWKDDSFNKEVEMMREKEKREKEKMSMCKGRKRGRLITVKDPIIQSMTDKVVKLSVKSTASLRLVWTRRADCGNCGCGKIK